MLLLFVGPIAAAGQSAEEDALAALRDAFRRLDYGEVDRVSDDALSRYESFAPESIVEIHTIRGLSHFYRDRADAARDDFRAALTLDPDLDLDPVLAAPQALDFFREVRAAFEQERDTVPPPESIRYFILHDPRPTAAVRSFLVPGWGQIYKKERLKGGVLLGLWIGAAGGGVAAHLAHADARRTYEDAGSTDVQAQYDTMNRWHKLRKRLAYTAAGIWVVSALDAVISGGPRSTSGDGSGFSVTVDPQAPGPGIRFQRRF